MHFTAATVGACTQLFNKLKGGCSMTHSDLFAMAMESNIAYKNMQIICKALGVPYPPKADDKTVIDLTKGLQPPVSAAFK